MATPEELAQLKLIVGREILTDAEFSAVIDLNPGNMDAAAAQVWEIRAGRYHGLVNISESGSSRNMGDLHKNALAMAATYRAKLVPTDGVTSGGRAGTRRIERQ